MSPSAILRCQEVKHLLADILHPRAIRYCSSDHVLQFVVIDLSAMNNGDISLWFKYSHRAKCADIRRT